MVKETITSYYKIKAWIIKHKAHQREQNYQIHYFTFLKTYQRGEHEREGQRKKFQNC